MPKHQDETGPQPIISQVTGLDDALRDKVPPHRRWLQGVGLAALLLVVIIALIHQTLPPSGPDPVTTTAKQAPVTAPPGGNGPDTPLTPNTIALQSNINYGITLNGKPIHSDLGGFVHVPDGNSILVFNTPPFYPMKCVITLPPQQGNGNCQSSGTSSNGTYTAPTINFQVGLDDLPPSQQSALLALFRQSFNQAVTPLNITVPTGQHYGYAWNQQGLPVSKVASFPLHAHVTAALATQNTNGCAKVVCPGYSIPQFTDSINVINFALGSDYGWRFTTADGTLVSTFSESSNSTALSNYPNGININVGYDSRTGWTLMKLDPGDKAQPVQVLQKGILENLCQAEMNPLANILFTQGSSNGGSSSNNTATLNGCSATITPNGGKGGTYIERFGALLAADVASQNASPALPLASQAEVAAASAQP